MSVRVNLLPRTVVEQQAARRRRFALLGGGAALLLVLVAVTFWQEGRISDAEQRLADEEQLLVALRADEQQLSEFAELHRRTAESEQLLQEAMGAEVSVAGILQDLASVMPSDAELESLTIDVTPRDPESGVESVSIGTFQATGRTLNDHAPGLERLLLELDKIAAFHDLFFSSSVLQDPDEPYPTFTVDAQLGPEIRTDRYDDGIPEGLR